MDEEEPEADDPAGPYARALALIEMRRLDDALSEVVRALAERSDDAYVHYLLGYVRLKQDDLSGAIHAAETSNGLAPDLGLGHSILAQIYLRMEVPTLAVSHATEAIGVNPRDALAYAIRGNCLWMLGHRERALADLTESRRLDPEDAYAGLILHDWLKREADAEGAAVELRRIAAIEPNNVDLLVRLSAERWDAGDYQGAADLLEDALRIDPTRANLAQSRTDALRSLLVPPFRPMRHWPFPALNPTLTAVIATLATNGWIAGLAFQFDTSAASTPGRLNLGIVIETAGVVFWIGAFERSLARAAADAWIVRVLRREDLLGSDDADRGREMIVFLAFGGAAILGSAFSMRFAACAASALLVGAMFAYFRGIEARGVRPVQRVLYAFAACQPGVIAAGTAAIGFFVEIDRFFVGAVYEAAWLSGLFILNWVAAFLTHAKEQRV